MASVTINTGEADHEDRLAESPRDKWKAILHKRWYYLQTNIDYDCRCLLQYIAEAEEFYAELGYETAEDMVRQAYEIRPEQAWAAVAYLKGRAAAGIPDAPVAMAAAAAQAEPLAQHGTNQHSGTNEGPDNINSSKGGTSQGYLLRRLARDAPEGLQAAKPRTLFVAINPLKCFLPPLVEFTL
jgi:hypothetical protein